MIAFRVDINKDIASGHIMRCMTIAEKVRAAGEEVLFISGDEYCSSFLTPKSFKYVITNSPADYWDSEIDLMKSIIKKYSIKCLFVDSYIVPDTYLKELNTVCKIAFIDDFLTKQLDVSLLLAPTQSRSLDFVNDLYKGTNTKLLLGKDYLIIRDEFLDLNDCGPDTKASNTNFSDKGILITTGGSDKYHFTLGIIKEILANSALLKNKYFVIIGSLNDDYEEIKALVKDCDSFVLLKNISNMGYYMHNSFYAISAGGNTVYELLCCKVALSTIALSDDQVALGKRLAGMNILNYEGDCRQDTKEVIAKCINTLEDISQNGINSKMQSAVEDYTDGLGATRIAKALIEL